MKKTIVGAAQGQKGLAVQPRRWVIERTFDWLGRLRRYSPENNPAEAATYSCVYKGDIRLFTSRSEDAHNSNVRSIDATLPTQL